MTFRLERNLHLAALFRLEVETYHILCAIPIAQCTIMLVYKDIFGVSSL